MLNLVKSQNLSRYNWKFKMKDKNCWQFLNQSSIGKRFFLLCKPRSKKKFWELICKSTCSLYSSVKPIQITNQRKLKNSLLAAVKCQFALIFSLSIKDRTQHKARKKFPACMFRFYFIWIENLFKTMAKITERNYK